MNAGGRVGFAEYLAICGAGIAGAVFLGYAFAGVRYDVGMSAQAAGYVDPLWQMGVTLGYGVLAGGALLSAGVAVWAGVRASHIAAVHRRGGLRWRDLFRASDE